MALTGQVEEMQFYSFILPYKHPIVILYAAESDVHRMTAGVFFFFAPHWMFAGQEWDIQRGIIRYVLRILWTLSMSRQLLVF